MKSINSFNVLKDVIKQTYQNADVPNYYSFSVKSKEFWTCTAVITLQYFSRAKQYAITWLNLIEKKKTIKLPWNITMLLIKANSKNQEDFFTKTSIALTKIGFVKK